ncbi:MAG: HAMP domain-containing sensor histidine kinase [Nitrososphaeraceae archaeon]
MILSRPVSSTGGNMGKKEDTLVFYGVDTVISIVLQFLNHTNNMIDACVDYSRPSLAIEIALLKEAFLSAKKRGVRLRYVTEITNDNISYCKQLLTMVNELRHLDGIKGNLYVSDTAYLAPATFHEKAKPASQLIYSNVKEIIEHQRYIFETFWNKASPAEQRIKEIEEGLAPEFYEVITDPRKAAQTITNLARSVKKEALFFFPNDKALVRADKLGLVDYVMKASHNGATVKIICSLSEHNAEIVKRIFERAPKIQILNGNNNSSYGMYIVDGEKFIRAELRNRDAENFSESVGLMVYSNRKTSVDSFKSIFELLWNESTSNEELRKAHEMQKEFINIVSHEMKTPTQAILGFSELVETHPEKSGEMIHAIRKNAERLQRLTNDILDVARIESQSLKLNKESVNIQDKIQNVIRDIENQIPSSSTPRISFVCPKEPIYVQADKVRLYGVLANLLNNAVKFTREGTIVATVNVKGNDEVIISVKDSGTGIHPEILPRLFTKFATKSDTGTGLGLFISKGVVEAHGGKIWAENNSDRKGTTFCFTLPLEK